MKKYELPCIHCGEEGAVFANVCDPEELVCRSCDTDIDMDLADRMAREWTKYFADLYEMKAREDKTDKEEKNGRDYCKSCGNTEKACECEKQ